MFPPVPAEMIEDGYQDFADRWNPILDVYDQAGVKFALEVHPGEIAYDFWTAGRVLEAAYADRIYHMHVKESVRVLNGRNGILGSHRPFGDHKRGWDFVSPGRGGVPFEKIFRALNDVGYVGPLSVEWEDNGMTRDQGAPEACALVKRLDLVPSGQAFEAAFASKN
jgi:sugar phosphate isomerase/epimerase